MSTATRVTYDAQDDWARQRGWRPCDAPPCPRTIAGGRCFARRHASGLCMCERYRRCLDNSRMWLDKHDQLVMTAEPYEMDGTELAGLLGEADAIELTVTITGQSSLSGATILIVRKRAEWRERYAARMQVATGAP